MWTATHGGTPTGSGPVSRYIPQGPLPPNSASSRGAGLRVEQPGGEDPDFKWSGPPSPGEPLQDKLSTAPPLYSNG
jgi:hypothetical protein